MKPWRFFKIKWFRRFIWRALRALPEPIKDEVLRARFPVCPVLPPELEFKVAETREELEAAFALLHDEFVSCRYMDPHPSGLRVTRYHALPGSTVLIGKWEGRVICTLTVILDSPFGLPMDSTWDLEALRRNYVRIAEISALAIRRDAQGRRGGILLPLCKFMYEFCTRYAAVDAILISTAESVKDFYRGILLFEPVGEGKPVRYGFVNHVLALAQYLDLRTAAGRYREVYGNKAPDRNLHRYFTECRFEQFRFPVRIGGQCAYPVMTPELLDYFFRDRVPIIPRLPPEERLALRSLYFEEEFQSVIDPRGSLRRLSRRERRLPAFFRATLLDPDSAAIQPVTVTEVAATGFGARLARPVVLHAPILLRISLDLGADVGLRAVPVWGGSRLQYGFRILDCVEGDWMAYVSVLRASQDSWKFRGSLQAGLTG